MHVDKDFELSETQISQHLAWLSTFFKLQLHLVTEIRLTFRNSTFSLSKFDCFTHVTSCYHMLLLMLLCMLLWKYHILLRFSHVTTCYCYFL